MDRSSPTSAGTDYTTQVSAVFVGVIATTVLSGIVAEAIGYTLTLIISVVISLSSLLWIPKVYRDTVRT
ncbi:MAG: hypothetical protein F6J96_33195 [Symploca sp. SIO1C2]|nr:hypothetical protein [Symploca sp. SIO1C2]